MVTDQVPNVFFDDSLWQPVDVPCHVTFLEELLVVFWVV